MELSLEKAKGALVVVMEDFLDPLVVARGMKDWQRVDMLSSAYSEKNAILADITFDYLETIKHQINDLKGEI